MTADRVIHAVRVTRTEECENGTTPVETNYIAPYSDRDAANAAAALFNALPNHHAERCYMCRVGAASLRADFLATHASEH